MVQPLPQRYLEPNDVQLADLQPALMASELLMCAGAIYFPYPPLVQLFSFYFFYPITTENYVGFCCLQSQCSLNTNYFTPVLPNPPAPLSVEESSDTSSHCACSTLANTSCAIRSPFSTTNVSFDMLIRITPTSPR